MDIVLGMLGLAVIIALAIRMVGAVRGVGKATAIGGRPKPRSCKESEIGGVATGWLVGHEIARGHDGFPGDPLPGGHLGSASDLAFWGSAFDVDEDEQRD